MKQAAYLALAFSACTGHVEAAQLRASSLSSNGLVVERSGSSLGVASVRLHKRLRTRATAERATLPLKASLPAGSRSNHPSEYYGQIKVGTPAKEFLVLFDTGSGNLLLPSTFCQSEACVKHARFNASASSTAENIAFTSQPYTPVGVDGDLDIVNLAYGTGEASGVIVRDRICVEQTCTTMNMVSATDESDAPFARAPFDGIMGLSLTQLSEGKAFNVLDAMLESQSVKKSMFSVFLGRTSEEPSEILFGSYRSELMEEKPMWLPVLPSGYWEVALTGLTVGQAHYNFSKASVVLDTGTSLLAGPPAVINELVDKLDVASDCSNIKALPDLSFFVGSKKLILSPEDYVDRDSSNHCSLSLMTQEATSSGGDAWIFGDPFLRKYYTIFDRSNMQVGIARAKHGVLANL